MHLILIFAIVFTQLGMAQSLGSGDSLPPNLSVMAQQFMAKSAAQSKMSPVVQSTQYRPQQMNPVQQSFDPTLESSLSIKDEALSAIESAYNDVDTDNDFDVKVEGESDLPKDKINESPKQALINRSINQTPYYTNQVRPNSQYSDQRIGAPQHGGAYQTPGKLLHDPALGTQNVNDSMTIALKVDVDKPKPLRQIGYNIFNRMYYIEHVDSSVVPPNYVLGIGDSMTLFIYGKKEQILDLTIDRSGGVFIPTVGPIMVAGLTLKEAESKISLQMKKKYANVAFKMVMNSVRKVNITLAGDVKMPGIYSVNKFGSVVSILALSGGVNKTGSLRTIQIIRQGKVAHRIDLYDLMITGRIDPSVYFEPNDVLFVPKIGDTVAIKGAVKIPGIYELLPRESIHHLIRYASGYNVNAFKNGLYLNRLDSDYKRQVSVIFHDSLTKFKQRLKKERLKNGDIIVVKERSSQQFGYVTLLGHVNVPGKVMYRKGLTLSDALKEVKGVKNSPNQRVQIYRYVSDVERDLVSTDLANGAFVLEDRDVIQVFDQLNDEVIHVDGDVKFPGEYKFLNGMALGDVLQIVDPKIFASLTNVEVSRFSGETSTLMVIDAINNPQFKLNFGDKINVKMDNRRDETVVIELTGEVIYPGQYRVNSGERLADVIERAGGFTEDAFLSGAVFTRESVKKYDKIGQSKVVDDEKRRMIYDQSMLSSLGSEEKNVMSLVMASRQNAINFLEEQANQFSGRVALDLKRSDFDTSNDNFVVQDGDKLTIPKTPASVHVIGGVQQSISIAYEKAYHTRDYIRLVGGFSNFADHGQIYVFKSSGLVAKNTHLVEPGDIIYVPEKVMISFNLMKFLTDITQIISNAVTSVALIRSIQ